MEDNLLNEINGLLSKIKKTEQNQNNHPYQQPVKQNKNKLKPVDGDTVTVNYSGKLLDGTEFDNSWKKGKPFEFVVGMGQVIKGWDRIIKRMHLGEKLRVRIPSDLAYGSKGVGNVIPPNSDLIFLIKLLKINGIE